MADIELVIKIPEEYYNDICNKETGSNYSVLYALDGIRNGTPLPKGYEKLIAEPTEEEIAETIGGKNDFADCIREAVKTVFANATTIIKESEG